jgi:hypothetical protein
LRERLKPIDNDPRLLLALGEPGTGHHEPSE